MCTTLNSDLKFFPHSNCTHIFLSQTSNCSDNKQNTWLSGLCFSSTRCSSSGGDAAAPFWMGVRVDLKPAIWQVQDAAGSPDDCGTLVSAHLSRSSFDWMKRKSKQTNCPSIERHHMHVLDLLSVVIQPDVPEVRGAALAATSALQKHFAGAIICWTLEISGGRHSGAADRPQRCKKTLFCLVISIIFFEHSQSADLWSSRQLFRTCTSATRRRWPRSSRWSSADWINLGRVKGCR